MLSSQLPTAAVLLGLCATTSPQLLSIVLQNIRQQTIYINYSPFMSNFDQKANYCGLNRKFLCKRPISHVAFAFAISKIMPLALVCSRAPRQSRGLCLRNRFSCLKNENIMKGLLLQLEGIHLYTYMPIYLFTYRGRNQECCFIFFISVLFVYTG